MSNTLHIEMSDPVWDDISSMIRNTYKNSCIVWIQSVNNKTLEYLFLNNKNSLQSPNIKRLFHGTSEHISNIIINNGFEPSLNKVSAYGKGVYFSTRALYSKNYCKAQKNDIAFMLICDVITGNVGQGKPNTNIPSQYDSVTDNINKPDMYIVNKKSAALPLYIVAFYPWTN